MNYFDEASEWYPLSLDVELYKEIKEYHPYLTSNAPCSEGIDGFYFVDQNDFAILVDMRGQQVRIRKKNPSDRLTYSRKFHIFEPAEFTVYYQDQLIIKDHKKFYKIVPQKRNLIMEFLFKKPFIRNIISSP